jgi:chromate reductase
MDCAQVDQQIFGLEK